MRTVRRMAEDAEAQQIEESRQRALVSASSNKTALQKMAERYDISSGDLKRTLRDTVFKDARTDSEFMALCVVANGYGLNPLTKEIYAFPAKGGGIVPMVSIDGWIRMMNEHPDFDGIEFNYYEDDKGNLEHIEAVISHKRRQHPIKVPEYLEENRRPTDPWKQMPRRMLRHRALIQCARIAFGFSGIHAEGDDIVEGDYTVVGEGGPKTLPRSDELRGDSIDPDTGEVIKTDAIGMTVVTEEEARRLDAGGQAGPQTTAEAIGDDLPDHSKAPAGKGNDGTLAPDNPTAAEGPADEQRGEASEEEQNADFVGTVMPQGATRNQTWYNPESGALKYAHDTKNGIKWYTAPQEEPEQAQQAEAAEEQQQEAATEEPVWAARIRMTKSAIEAAVSENGLRSVMKEFEKHIAVLPPEQVGEIDKLHSAKRREIAAAKKD